MLFNRYDKVENLETGKSEWTIRVRAQTIWKGVNRQTNEFRGLNVIFIDDSVRYVIFIAMVGRWIHLHTFIHFTKFF